MQFVSPPITHPEILNLDEPFLFTNFRFNLLLKKVATSVADLCAIRVATDNPSRNFESG